MTRKNRSTWEIMCEDYDSELKQVFITQKVVNKVLKNRIDKVNSSLFLEYIKEYGFNPDNYRIIWELSQSVEGSMSQFLKRYNQFLLSKRVKEEELVKMGINGANGFLSFEGRIAVYNNRYYPQIDPKDVIISNGIPTIISAVSYYSYIDKYIGFCMDKDDYDLKKSITDCNHLLELLNKNNNNYVLEHDTLSSKSKELFLIRKK